MKPKYFSLQKQKYFTFTSQVGGILKNLWVNYSTYLYTFIHKKQLRKCIVNFKLGSTLSFSPLMTCSLQTVDLDLLLSLPFDNPLTTISTFFRGTNYTSCDFLFFAEILTRFSTWFFSPLKNKRNYKASDSTKPYLFNKMIRSVWANLCHWISCSQHQGFCMRHRSYISPRIETTPQATN
jgi:hypothetical protein